MVYRVNLYTVIKTIFLSMIISVLVCLSGMIDLSVTAILFVLVIIVIVIAGLNTKLIIEKDEITLKGAFNLFTVTLKWQEIIKLEFKKALIILHGKGLKMPVGKTWNNYRQLWLTLYEKIHQNKNIVIDKKFIEVIKGYRT